MKKIILVLVILGLMITPVWAVETTLTTPLVITEPATKMIQYSFTVIPSENKVRAEMQWKDASGNLLTFPCKAECEFTDPAVTNAVIASGKVGQKYIDVMAAFIQTKCKGLWNITGTDN